MHSSIRKILPGVLFFALAAPGHALAQDGSGTATSETSMYSDSLTAEEGRKPAKKNDGIHLSRNDIQMTAIGVKAIFAKHGGFLDSALWTLQLKKATGTISSMLAGRYPLLIEMGLAYPVLSPCLADMTIEGRRSPGIRVLKEIPEVIETRCEDKAVIAEANYELLQILCNHFHDTLVFDIAALAAAGAMNNNPSYIKKVINFLIESYKIKTLGRASFFLADAGKDDVTTFFCDNNWDDDAFITGLMPGIVVNQNTAQLFENAIREDRFKKDTAGYKTIVSHLGSFYKATKQRSRYDSMVNYTRKKR